MHRRTILSALLALPAAAASTYLFAAPRSSADIEAMRGRWRDFLPDGFTPPDAGSELELGDKQWRARLTDAQFRVLREDGTERAFSNPLNDEKRPGIFACAGCQLSLFSSEMKYDSGTGWPSFFTTIPGSVKTRRDYRYGWTRVEYHCARCGGHQGHVFDDGPPPTRQRWCNNGVALQFMAAS